jgi:hypothetical protein
VFLASPDGVTINLAFTSASLGHAAKFGPSRQTNQNEDTEKLLHSAKFGSSRQLSKNKILVAISHAAKLGLSRRSGQIEVPVTL